MGDEVGGVPEAAPVGAAEGAEAAGGGSIGRYLARQRQLRNISLEQLGGLTKIPVRSLERLESGAFDQEPDGFARGFVRTVAEALGLDPDDAVLRLMREPPEEEPGPRRAWPGPRASLLGAALLLGLLFLGALVWRLVAATGQPATEIAAPEVLLRQDPVRSLAREQEREAPPTAAPQTTTAEP